MSGTLKSILRLSFYRIIFLLFDTVPDICLPRNLFVRLSPAPAFTGNLHLSDPRFRVHFSFDFIHNSQILFVHSELTLNRIVPPFDKYSVILINSINNDGWNMFFAIFKTPVFIMHTAVFAFQPTTNKKFFL